MFCIKCGKQIRDDASFCQYCGVAQNQVVNGNGQQADNIDGFDRTALKIYLANILSLEMTIQNYIRRANDACWQIERQHIGYYYDRWTQIREGASRYAVSESVYLYYDGKESYIAYDNDGSMTTFKSQYRWEKVNSALLTETWPWKNACSYLGFLERKKRAKELREGFNRVYASFSAEAPLAYQENIKKYDTMVQMINGMNQEVESARELLRKAYDINIIPEQFRGNIHAIYYLHSFISTSRESFTTALLHLDLDEIKSKLDTIIEQQETVIIQNAKMISQNSELIKQNQEHLEYLSSIEQNTSQAAQYAQIAANNAEACAWFSMANYIEALN